MAMNVLLTLSSIIFPLITLPYVTRALGPEGVGKVYFASSVIAFFSMFAELGIPVYGIRACARVRDDKIALTRTVHEIITINLAACIIVYAVFAVSLICVPAFKADRNMFIIMSSLIVLNAIGAEWLYKALEKLTEKERKLIEALFFEEMTEREVALSLGISQPAVHKQKNKILKKLKFFLEN